MDSNGPPQYWPYPSQFECNSSDSDNEGTQQSSDKELPMKRGPSPSWLDGWDNFHSNNVHSSPGVSIALRLLREISNMSWKEWQATSAYIVTLNLGAPNDNTPPSLCDTALQHLDTAHYELFKLRQDMFEVGKALLQAAGCVVFASQELRNRIVGPFYRFGRSLIGFGMSANGKPLSRYVCLIGAGGLNYSL
ncbi:hypothetical protein BT96DRAFT_1032977 [Gymnopus androsaceus JB14]|uniref:Uncharacterized protein n=1 Tax=Gymnopus androsaceus JB14 TaxID=1447944 RepID=A0A6A4HMG2_9AGAR|nr:hypothetical protein BT96DRAFT_1032977 [Gymnopus androsaceus JB14]